MIKYEDYVNGANPDIKDYSNEALYERGKFLVEVIDKIKKPLNGSILNKTIIDNTSKNKNSRLVISSIPGSGKTTAMRQYIVSGYERTSGVVAMNRIDDIEKFYYDIIANIIYSYPKPKHDEYDDRFYTPTRYKRLVLYTSNNRESISMLKHSDWIFCTHQRLLTDPESLLYQRVSGGQLVHYDVERSELFIDELPTSMYNRYSSEDITPVLAANALIGDEYGTSSKKVTDEQRFNFITQSLATNDFSKSLALQLIDKTPRKGASLFKLKGIINKSNDQKVNDEIERSLAKIYEMFNYCINYNTEYSEKILVPIREFNKTASPEHQKPLVYPSYTTYYSIIRFNIKNIIIFDGTADLILKNSGWKLIGSPICRKINIDYIQKVKTNVDRVTSSEEKIIESFYSIISQVNKKYNGTKNLLVYMWKSKKPNIVNEGDNKSNSEKEIVSKLNDKLLANGINNVKLVTYKSGKEKSTNEYINSDVVIILGKFFIPSRAIVDFNKANLIDKNHPMTTENYTLSLIIQLLYRTRARLNDQNIDLYIDDDYGKKFNSTLLEQIDCKTKIDDEEIESSVLPDNYNQKVEETLDKLGISNKDDKKEFTTSELKETLGIKGNRSVKEIIRIATNKGLLKYKITRSSSGGYGNETKVCILNPLKSKST